MTKLNFISICEYTTTDENTGFLYTIRETENDINYKYYFLTTNEEHNISIEEVKNPLEQLKKLTLKKLDEEKYLEAITAYMEASNPEEQVKMTLTNTK